MTRPTGDFHTLMPHITVDGAARAIEFYAAAFGAVELYRNTGPDGEKIQHAELLLGDSRFFVVDSFPEWGVLSPVALGGSPVTLHLYVVDADALWARALDAGAEVVLPLADQFWGDRYGILRDPFGHRWSIARRNEDLSPAELRRRADEFHSNQQDGSPTTPHRRSQ